MRDSSTFVCVLCGGVDCALLHQDLPDLHLEQPTGYRAQLVQCARCGLIAQWPTPSNEQLTSFYPDAYSPFQARASGVHPTQRVFRSRRPQFVTRHVRSGRLLDVGCSTGAFLLDMQAVGGWSCTGIEPSRSAVMAARARGLDVHEMNMEQLGAHADLGRFDAITLWDVLEHLRDPVESLRQLRTMLADNGVLVIGIPNGDSLEYRLFGRWWSGLEAPRHLFVFSRRTIAAVLSAAGFDVQEIRNGPGLYLTFVNTLLFRLRAAGVAYAATQRIGALLRAAPLRLLAEPFFRLTSVGVRGSKMVVTARANAHTPGNVDELRSEGDGDG
jgi:2-polyprenyl-3-methyl-5-hydroxy-6-metoxy-1,4-benzoquinol methylase